MSFLDSEPLEDLNVTAKIEEIFPGAISGVKLAAHVKEVLNRNGYSDRKTLLATSLCCDEVNRDFEQDLTSVYGSNFSMGGLAGFAFGGVTSFGAMAHHIPDGFLPRHIWTPCWGGQRWERW